MNGGVFTEQARAFMRGCSQPALEKPFTRDELHRAIALMVDAERSSSGVEASTLRGDVRTGEPLSRANSRRR